MTLIKNFPPVAFAHAGKLPSLVQQPARLCGLAVGLQSEVLCLVKLLRLLFAAVRVGLKDDCTDRLAVLVEPARKADRRPLKVYRRGKLAIFLLDLLQFHAVAARCDKYLIVQRAAP